MAIEIVIYLASFLVLYIFTKHLLHKIQSLPPCPYPILPIIGHLYLVKRPLYRTLSKISHKHGPILFFRFGSRPVLLVSSPSLAEECLAKNDITFANRPPLLAGKHLGYNYTELVWSPYNDHWRKLRRISSMEILSANRLQMLSNIRAEEVKSIIRRLAIEQNRPTVEMRTLFFELTLNVIMRMVAGKRYYGERDGDSEEARRFQEMVAETAQLGGVTILGDFLPFLQWFEHKKGKAMKELQWKRDKFMEHLIEEHKRMSDCSSLHGKNTLVGILLSLQEKEPDYYKDEIIKGLMTVLLVGATETSVNTLEWSLALLLNHPQVMKKAQIEIDNHVGHERLIGESDIAQLPYLCGIIKETMRIYPPLPLAVPHESSEECRVGGFRVPRGTMLLVNLWGIQNDPTVWEDPGKFKPQRFEGIEGPRDGYSFMPFGSGRRSCPGEGLAMRIVGLELGSLIQCFEWERVGEEMVDMSERTTSVSLAKAQPLHAKCRPRSAMITLLSQI